MAPAGVTARRGEPVKGDARLPKDFQWSGTLGKSVLGKRTGTLRHAPQYAPAACASRILTASTVSAVANRFRNSAIKSAIAVLLRSRRATFSCPLNFAAI